MTAPRPRPSLLVFGDSLERGVLAPLNIDVTFSDAKRPADVIARLQGIECHCVLLRLRMPAPQSLEVLRKVREQDQKMPIVLLMDGYDERLIHDSIEAGATDCVPSGAGAAARLRQSIALAIRAREKELEAVAERHRLRRLQRFTAALAAKRTVSEVAQLIVVDGRTAFEAPRALLAIVDATEGMIEVVRTDGYQDDVLVQWKQFSLAAPLPLADAVRADEPLFFGDCDALMARYPHLAPNRVAGDEALLIVPLSIARWPIGVIALTYDQPRQLTDDDREELVAFSKLCSQALDRAQLFDRAQLERQRLEQISRAKDQFLAIVSHELRTPLNAMLGWATMLQAGSLTPEQARHATAVIERNARAQAQLIDDLLDVSRITTGQLQIKTGPVDLADVLAAALDVVRPAAEAKGVELHPCACGPFYLVADGQRLQQVFWNLLSNAVKFTPRGGSVAATVERQASSFVIKIADSGQGIPPEFLPHVFQPFRQHDISSARATSGIGLGLSIVRHLVELHGGTVKAESEGLGEGSTLTVQLPFNTAREEATSDYPPAAEPMVDVYLSGIRILVVDDDVDAREVLASQLELRHAEVTLAATAQEAFKQLQALRPDLIISDIAMPVEDGYLLMQQIRALPAARGGETPAIALTALARGDDRAKALLAGYTAHVAKPIDPNQLARLVQSVLDPLCGVNAPPARGWG